ncbi:MAG: hypothetical protein AAFW81_09360 [Pseudomonadota bacterium]
MFGLKRKRADEERRFTPPDLVQKGHVEGGDPSCDWMPEIIVYDGKSNGYSIAVLKNKSGKLACGIRWNGSSEYQNTKGNAQQTGTPQPGGNAFWFVLPEFLEAPILQAANQKALEERIEKIENEKSRFV